MNYDCEALTTLTNIQRYRSEEANKEDRLRQLDEDLISSKISNMSATPVSGGGNKTETVWGKIIDDKAPIEKRIRELRHYIRRFDRAWAILTEDEQNILETFFVIGGYRCFARVNDRLHIGGRATIYRHRQEALQKYIKAYG